MVITPAAADFKSHFLPHWRSMFVVFIGCTMTACGMVDYSLQPENFANSAKQQNDLGKIYFHFAGEAEPFVLHARKVKSGYALQTPMFNDASSNTDFTFSRTRERGYFVGVQSHLDF